MELFLVDTRTRNDSWILLLCPASYKLCYCSQPPTVQQEADRQEAADVHYSLQGTERRSHVLTNVNMLLDHSGNLNCTVHWKKTSLTCLYGNRVARQQLTYHCIIYRQLWNRWWPHSDGNLMQTERRKSHAGSISFFPRNTLPVPPVDCQYWTLITIQMVLFSQARAHF